MATRSTMRAVALASAVLLFLVVTAQALQVPADWTGSANEVCTLLRSAAWYSSNSYAEDCRVHTMPEGLLVELHRGKSAFGSQYSCESDLLIEGENTWSLPARGFMYLFALLYCFLGIAIVADIFMGAIEEITSAKKEVVVKNAAGKEKTVEVDVWNGTVANLTLMALGSSAPEILLSILGVVFTLGEEADPLGPGTIVGSAAFNLLCISAVCIVAPCPDFRQIKEYGVFVCTAFFSVWAYVWLLIIIDFWTPEEVTVPEALITFLHFPVLVFFAYGQDKKWKFKSNLVYSEEGEEEEPHGAEKHSLEYKMNAVRLISGAPRILLRRKTAHMEAVDDNDTPEFNAERMSSDPYVKVSQQPGGRYKKTKYKRHRLNPIFREEIEAPASDKATKLQIDVLDHDDLSKDDFLGTVSINLSQLAEKPNVAQTFELELTDKSGKALVEGSKVKVAVTFVAIGKPIKVFVERCTALPATERENQKMDKLGSAFTAKKEALFRTFKKHYGIWQEMKEAYRGQFETALRVAGPLDDNGNELPPTAPDMLMHFLTVFWKVFFSFIPPPNFYGGWLAFGVALIFIGGVTYVVGELAALFGCVVGLQDSITAITFVALGTSLPDTFASKSATIAEATADNAIGNVTGSNGVNVFLGIGLPWLIAAAYQEADGKTFVVRSNGFGLSVAVFIACAFVFFALLTYRRLACGGELGGNPTTAKIHATVAFLLWMLYIIMASLRYEGHIGDIWTVNGVASPPAPVSFTSQFVP